MTTIKEAIASVTDEQMKQVFSKERIAKMLGTLGIQPEEGDIEGIVDKCLDIFTDMKEKCENESN